MRDVLLADLIHEVLGPRGGPTEVLTGDPRGLYITGILAPEPLEEEVSERNIEAEAEIPTEELEVPSGEEDLEDQDTAAPPVFSPALDPRELPRGIGLSFAVDTPDIVEMEVCLSWARYRKDRDDWIREPRVHLTESLAFLPGENTTLHFGPQGPCPPEAAEVALHVLVRALPGSQRIMVTLYLANRLRSARRGDTEAHIFQPQIRVLCRARLVPALLQLPAEGLEDEQKLEFLQRDRPVLARGHLCSAVWRGIDPEQEVSGHPLPDLPPFTWIDGGVLSQDECRRFSPPDVRTEFVPVYAIAMPDFRWRSDQSLPELRADILAECWDRDRLTRAISPLIEGYDSWVRSQDAEVRQFEQLGHAVARRIHNECVDALRRMRAGLNILLNDADARLAFCFACKAIDLQHRWVAERTAALSTQYEWRPFQLAFVLMVLESLVRRDSYDRDLCDLLWVPTGLGKTEAYLALAAFTMAYRRRRALRRRDGTAGLGTATISRYTLRLLTIQQFRRALAMVTACEYLRVDGAGRGVPVGWRPSAYQGTEDFFWGSGRFSIGLWVGGQVTPNHLETIWVEDGSGGRRPIHGAIAILKGETDREGVGEPAQVLDCPACGSTLALPETGLPPGQHTLHFVMRSKTPAALCTALRTATGTPLVADCRVVSHAAPEYHTVTVTLSCTRGLLSRELDEWWRSIVGAAGELVCARPSRPGYFVKASPTLRGGLREYDFEVFCPNPECPLSTEVIWLEGVPVDDGLVNLALERGQAGSLRGVDIRRLQRYEVVLPGGRRLTLPDGLALRACPAFLRLGTVGSTDVSPLFMATRVPLPALTVDDQVYHRCPSMVIATVDKFARLSFEPNAGGIFGHVDRHHPRQGYYRDGAMSSPPTGAGTGHPFNVTVTPFEPPELVLQDELHLVEGPLGSLAGLYETAVEALCKLGPQDQGPKYIASTATIRQAREQVRSLFLRRLFTFPPHGVIWEDRFFLLEREPHPAEEEKAGRLYVGICAPGRGPLTPIVRIMARLLQSANEQRLSQGDPAVDPFWTLVAYFNALRELAGARALYRQDIPEWVGRQLAVGGAARPLPDDAIEELSSQRSSTDLPRILARLSVSLPDAVDALFATSMFGTGVDVRRLALMLVNGQPKTTSAYIQATGRVGRAHAGLVVTFLRASRPRDLSHYEFFCGYHRRLYTFVEPVTVMPFSPGALERAGGPVAVAILRNGRALGHPWHQDGTARDMQHRRSQEGWLADLFERRGTEQPGPRQPATGTVKTFLDSELDRWSRLAASWADLRYVEYAIDRPPQFHVVLGDTAHRGREVYPLAPQSLRDVEDTVKVQT